MKEIKTIFEVLGKEADEVKKATNKKPFFDSFLSYDEWCDSFSSEKHFAGAKIIHIMRKYNFDYYLVIYEHATNVNETMIYRKRRD